MARQLISSGSEWEARFGYSRAVVDGDLVFVAGTTGMDYAKGTIAPDVAEQTEQCLRNIEAALAQAGASLADAVRIVVYLVDAAEMAEVGPVLGRRFKDIRPACTAVAVAGLIDPRMRVEIELTARKGNR